MADPYDMAELLSVRLYRGIYYRKTKVRLAVLSIITVNLILYLCCYIIVTPGPYLDQTTPANQPYDDSQMTRIQQGVVTWIPRVDSHDYAYIHNPVNKCKKSNASDPDLLLIMFVNSAPSHRSERDFVRHTFGNENAWPKVRGKSVTQIVFLLGEIKNKVIQSAIDEESALFHDIVQESFIDSYLNLTLKSVMGFKWVSLFCREAKFVMKVDDDVLINTPLIHDVLQSAPTTDYAFGEVLISGPIRHSFSKYYTPSNIYPHSSYPPYFRGYAYMLSTDVGEKVYRTSMITPLFPWSDVFVGMCLDKLNIELKHMALFGAQVFRLSMGRLATDKNALSVMRNYASVWHFKREHQVQLWNIWQTPRSMNPRSCVCANIV